MARELSGQAEGPGRQDDIDEQVTVNVHKLIGMLLDPNRARFSRNRREVEEGLETLGVMIAGTDGGEELDSAPSDAAARFWSYWQEQKPNIFSTKSDQLTNQFRIKALVEENSLIANRLLSTASNEFASASSELTDRTQLVSRATRYNLTVMAVTIAILAGGSLGLWLILRARVLRRLDKIRAALQASARGRSRTIADTAQDEIGDISRALSGYMDEIEGRELELSQQTKALQQLSAKLSKYLSPQVYDSIFSGRQDVKVSSTRKKLTVFFSDIVGFTEAADRMESEELTNLLNNYLTEMTQIALNHGATIDKYIGDAIMAFFGDPETRGAKEDALACVNMAIAMRDRLRDLADDWRHAGIEIPLNCRAGIHTGYCTVGNFGSETRMDYTIIGGPVNLASRLESAAEPGQMLISYETFALVQDEIECKEMGHISVKGISYPIATYLVAGRRDRAADRILEKVRGLSVDIDLSAMTDSDRQTAESLLEQALALVRNDDQKLRNR
jgi:class 3 adenylate cyclase